MTTQALYHIVPEVSEETVVAFDLVETDRELTTEEVDCLTEEGVEIEFFLGCLAY